MRDAQAQEQWKKACDRFAELNSQVEEMLKQREESYLKLLGGSAANNTEVATFSPLFQSWAGLRKPPAGS